MPPRYADVVQMFDYTILIVSLTAPGGS